MEENPENPHYDILFYNAKTITSKICFCVEKIPGMSYCLESCFNGYIMKLDFDHC